MKVDQQISRYIQLSESNTERTFMFTLVALLASLYFGQLQALVVTFSFAATPIALLNVGSWIMGIAIMISLIYTRVSNSSGINQCLDLLEEAILSLNPASSTYQEDVGCLKKAFQLLFNRLLLTKNSDKILACAAFFGEKNILESLPKGLKKIDSVQKDNLIIGFALLGGQQDLIQWLIDRHGFTIPTTGQEAEYILEKAGKNSQKNLIKWLVEKHHVDGQLAMLVAAFYNDQDLIKWLVDERGITIPTKDAYTMRLIVSATLGGRKDLIKWFVEKHHVDGQLAMLVAAFYNDQDLIKWLVDERGITIPTTSNHTRDLMQKALIGGHFELFKWLVNEYNIDSQLALYVTLNLNKRELIDWLVKEKSADINAIITGVGTTALHIAAGAGKLELFKWLIEELECNIYIKNIDGGSVLHSAAQNGHQAIVEYLICERNFDPFLKDFSGRSAYEYAESNGHHQLAAYIMQDRRKKPRMAL